MFLDMDVLKEVIENRQLYNHTSNTIQPDICTLNIALPVPYTGIVLDCQLQLDRRPC